MLEFARQLARLVRPYRSRLVLGIVMGILAGFADPLLIPVGKLVADVMFPSGNAGAAGDLLDKASPFLPGWLLEWGQRVQEQFANIAARNPVGVLCVVILIPAVVVLRGLLGYLNVYCMQWAAVRAITDLRVRLFTHLIHQPMRFFQDAKTGDLISRISNDTGALQQTLSYSISSAVRDPATLIGVLGYLLWNYPQWTLSALLVFPAAAIPVTIYSRKVRKSSRAIQNEYSELGTIMHESFTGARVVKAYNLEATMTERFTLASRRFISHLMRVVRSLEIPGPLVEFLGALGLSACLLYLGLYADPKPSAGDFLSFVLGVFLMYKPTKSITRLWGQFEQARAASLRVFQLLATRSDLVESEKPRPLQARGADIHFEGVSFRYNEKPVLSDVNLTVKSGQLVALVGASGSGKTTLTSLLLRFYDPQQGRVRIGNTDLRDASFRDLRAAIAVVTQETILFNDTIRNNIALGRPGASEADIEAAARHAHATEFIAERPQGLDTLIGEKGVALSGGQRQRLAIARAILKDSPILVLDEATSALDSESERIVQTALDELMEGRTTLCIAHRLSTIQRADLIVVLDQGRIVETGTHADLLQRNGLYARLDSLQFHSNGGEDARPTTSP